MFEGGQTNVMKSGICGQERIEGEDEKKSDGMVGARMVRSPRCDDVTKDDSVDKGDGN